MQFKNIIKILSSISMNYIHFDIFLHCLETNKYFYKYILFIRGH